MIFNSNDCLKNAAPLIRIPPGLASRKRRLRRPRSLSQPLPLVSALAGHSQDGGIVGRAAVGIREPDPHELVTGLGFQGGSDCHLAGVVGEVEQLGDGDQLPFQDFQIP